MYNKFLQIIAIAVVAVAVHSESALASKSTLDLCMSGCFNEEYAGRARCLNFYPPAKYLVELETCRNNEETKRHVCVKGCEKVGDFVLLPKK